MNYLKNAWNVFDNLLLGRLQNRNTTSQFWYLSEPPNIKNKSDLERYKKPDQSPFYLVDYREKLKYSEKNNDGIIVLNYQKPIGAQVNPEAAFQYALGLHDEYLSSQNEKYLADFNRYANYFLQAQTSEGLWCYEFDWYGSESPWYSALAQARGASVMLRAWLLSNNDKYLHAAKKALSKFDQPTNQGGFQHNFPQNQCVYFEEYPKTPTAVLNGFMAALICIWELYFWTNEKKYKDLWTTGIASLVGMLPYYSNGWWSLYDLDDDSPVKNVNSPRYHLLEINYLLILAVLSGSIVLTNEYRKRLQQYNRKSNRMRATILKLTRKILYK